MGNLKSKGLSSIWVSFSLGDVLQTALMAIVGTVVSFVTIRLLGSVRRGKSD